LNQLRLPQRFMDRGILEILSQEAVKSVPEPIHGDKATHEGWFWKEAGDRTP
jgi:hypothetical protein